MNKIIRLILSFCFLGAVSIVFIGVVFPNIIQHNANSIIVAALSVLAATMSAWIANQIIERENEKRRPIIYLYLDFERHGLVQLVVANVGEQTAYNINFKWEIEPKDEGIDSILPEDEIFTALIPKEKVYRNLGRGFKLMPYHIPGIKGIVKYQDSSKKKYSETVSLDINKYSRQMDHTNERITAEYQIQKLPEKLDKINSSLNNLIEEIRKFNVE